METRTLIQEMPDLGKAVMLFIDGKGWRCYIWLGDFWQRFDDRREPQPDDRWKPLPPENGQNWRQPT